MKIGLVEAATAKAEGGAQRGSLEVLNVSKKRGGSTVLNDVSLTVRPGEFVSLLGPSGCGKTTLLRLVAGLDAADEGRIVISGADVTSTAASERPVHTVFQSYALFPHLTVFENVAFGLRLRKRPDGEIRSRVSNALAAVRLDAFGERRTSEISGGQGQRVALARALVLDPDILLLDEPLAALDAQLRQTMRSELVALQRTLGATFVLVTHDLEEAIECSSRIAVMREGRIAQFAEPRQIFERPASVYVARLVGMENLLEARVSEQSGHAATVDLGFTRVELRDTDLPPRIERVGVHAEHIELSPASTTADANPVGLLEQVRYLGEVTRCSVRVGETTLTANVSPTSRLVAGERVSVRIAPDAFVPLAP
jgi:spermidine/putrescine transport system ATP-binding protein